jgi:hypothetical protein
MVRTQAASASGISDDAPMGAAKQPAKPNGPGQLTRRQPPLLPLSGAAGRRRGASLGTRPARATCASIAQLCNRGCTVTCAIARCQRKSLFPRRGWRRHRVHRDRTCCWPGVTTVPPGRHWHLGSGTRKRLLAASAELARRSRQRPARPANTGHCTAEHGRPDRARAMAHAESPTARPRAV